MDFLIGFSIGFFVGAVLTYLVLAVACFSKEDHITEESDNCSFANDDNEKSDVINVD